MGTGKYSIYDKDSGEEAWVSERAYDVMEELGIIKPDGQFASEDELRKLGFAVWDVVLYATKE